ncbi:hypothetical protein BO94DRAFT_575790 [Aspergillus sclerotioniger CBS 115572]|uniref:Zn(2)-C6 fungal-type domain-containing protein n=1 Tax=Aspergillus sclerotioniger CBS 115572 TaxID=1450535 RepID=A0A317WH45_9EURO|nr:hypothetical protein BO94DRAFT_575790 [Aspergillus sclerotioniger CBS 115572]PWY85794.1 hypothetical protein BO94DRAFT_575790 [Aspergillus sclerotioniger CBS 115572]
MVESPEKRPRPRRPKQKGCHECSQRRVNCDRKEPTCGKCEAKGIECSGLGIRVRFCHGVASRGKLVGRDASGEKLPCQTDIPSSSSLRRDPSAIPAVIDPLAQWERILVDYFNKTIAPNMIAVDGEANGYRTLILPAAELYPCVLKAVLASSAHHIALRVAPDHRSEAVVRAHELYTDAISALQQLTTAPTTTHTPNAITSLVLLICTMITGSEDFPFLFRMLSASLSVVNLGHDDQLGPPLYHFLNIQMQKFKLYARPFLLPANDIPQPTDTLLTDGLACLLLCSRLHPEHSARLIQASQLIQIASELYGRRACGEELDSQSSTELVEQFINTLVDYRSTQSLPGRYTPRALRSHGVWEFTGRFACVG